MKTGSSRFRKLRNDARSGNFGDCVDLLTRLRALNSDVPVSATPVIKSAMKANIQLLEFPNAAAASVLLYSIREQFGYMLSKSPEGPAIITVGVPSLNKEFSGMGKTEGLAIIDVYCSLLIGDERSVAKCGASK